MSIHPKLATFVTKKELALLVIACAFLAALAFSSTIEKKPFASAEVQFTDASAHGLAIVPASCPSSPHYAGECGTVTGGYAQGSYGPGTGTGGGRCTPSYTCSGSSLYYISATCRNYLVQGCAYGCSGGACLPPPSPSFTPFPATRTNPSDGSTVAFTADGTLQVFPSLVRRNGTVQLYWNAANVSSCTISGTNGDSWTDKLSGGTGKVSSAIVAQTVYTLTCNSLPRATPATITDTVTVNVVPVFNEN
ncbi:hypothetical protein K8R03_01600 [Candidatus Kaiserbacteria bacterium]|nr:hypothetical protein [Candidatus Kaiserbacteria bacterium]